MNPKVSTADRSLIMYCNCNNCYDTITNLWTTTISNYHINNLALFLDTITKKNTDIVACADIANYVEDKQSISYQ